MNQTLVGEIVFSILGYQPLEINKMTYGEMNTVYEVRMPDKKVIFRANELKQPLEGTKDNIEILSQLGIPVPAVIYADVTKEKYPFAFILLDKILGRDLRFVLSVMSVEQISELARNIVSIQKRVSTLPSGEGYGFAPINKKANSQTWSEYIEWDIQCGLPEIKDVVGENGIKAIKKQTEIL
ncbi:phosphotransferase family protein [Bacillus niameyensis]|uniref:phosphotransferase n=1 Tax=Bacillus niameyensis TaxID=1522308 RepID=UPI0007847964|nr:phosphotransferase [Bacillus niameyensis]